jgi:hypothetical protein
LHQNHKMPTSVHLAHHPALLHIAMRALLRLAWHGLHAGIGRLCFKQRLPCWSAAAVTKLVSWQQGLPYNCQLQTGSLAPNAHSKALVANVIRRCTCRCLVIDRLPYCGHRHHCLH